MNVNTNGISIEYWLDILRPLFNGKKVIVTGGVLAGLIPRTKLIRALGAESTFILATEGTGTGDMPSVDDGPWLALDSRKSETMSELNNSSQDLLQNLPIEVLNAFDTFDPKKEALIVGTFFHEPSIVAGRKALAYRRPEWLAMDDKTVIDKLWDEIGIVRENSVIIPVEREKIVEAMQTINRGNGVVLCGDSKEGVNGGAESIRWVREIDNIDRALPYYLNRCDNIRVMPFLEGIPCSIHGMVFEDYVAAFRPVEMIVLRNLEEGTFLYCGAANNYDPPTSDREEMRLMAKKVGEVLRNSVDYRGLFTIDGVMTKDGFRPTELNTRPGAGISTLLRGLPDFPLELIAQATMAGLEVDYQPQKLEELIVHSADEARGTTIIGRPLDKILPHISNRNVKYVKNSWQWAHEDDPIDGIVDIGPSPIGSYVRLKLQCDIPVGLSCAPIARDFWRFIDENFETTLGTLVVPSNVRSI